MTSFYTDAWHLAGWGDEVQETGLTRRICDAPILFLRGFDGKLAAMAYPPEARTNHWLDMRWDAPATMRLTVGATPEGQSRDTGGVVEQFHILTPASETETHYFWLATTAFPLDDPDMKAGVTQIFQQTFDFEDKPMIEAAYANVGPSDFWKQNPVFLGIDAGGTRVRRVPETLRRRNDVTVMEAAQ